MCERKKTKTTFLAQTTKKLVGKKMKKENKTRILTNHIKSHVIYQRDRKKAVTLLGSWVGGSVSSNKDLLVSVS